MSIGYEGIGRTYTWVSHVEILSQADWVTTTSSTLVHKLEKDATTPRVVCGDKDYVSASSEDINITCEQCKEKLNVRFPQE